MPLAPDKLIEAFTQGSAAQPPFGVTMGELALVEDTLVNHFLPPYKSLTPDQLDNCRADWRARQRLIDVLRGSDFSGRLVDMSLQPLSNPAEELLALSLNRTRRLSQDQLRELGANVVGFSLTANVLSSSPAIHGTIARCILLTRDTPNSVQAYGKLGVGMPAWIQARILLLRFAKRLQHTEHLSALWRHARPGQC